MNRSRSRGASCASSSPRNVTTASARAASISNAVVIGSIVVTARRHSVWAPLAGRPDEAHGSVAVGLARRRRGRARGRRSRAGSRRIRPSSTRRSSEIRPPTIPDHHEDHRRPSEVDSRDLGVTAQVRIAPAAMSMRLTLMPMLLPLPVRLDDGDPRGRWAPKRFDAAPCFGNRLRPERPRLDGVARANAATKPRPSDWTSPPNRPPGGRGPRATPTCGTGRPARLRARARDAVRRGWRGAREAGARRPPQALPLRRQPGHRIRDETSSSGSRARHPARVAGRLDLAERLGAAPGHRASTPPAGASTSTTRRSGPRRNRRSSTGSSASASCCPLFAKRVAADLELGPYARDWVCAVAVTLVNRGWFRVGSERYARTGRTYGITTLTKRHVAVRGSAISFRFRGKHRVLVRTTLVDAELAEAMRALAALRRRRAAPALRSRRASRRTSPAPALNDVHRRTPRSTTSRRRTSAPGAARSTAAVALAEHGPPASAADERRVLAAVMRRVGRELGNTPAVARASYVSPAVIEQWRDGRTLEQFRARSRARRLGPRHRAASQRRPRL